MLKYQELLRAVINDGIDMPSRNAPVRSLKGYQVKYDLEEGFPLLTTKRMNFNAIKSELLCFIRGYCEVRQFRRLGCNIWDANAKEWDRGGWLGRIYGVQWREWGTYRRRSGGRYVDTIDQLQECIDGIKEDPFSRRHIVTAWNPADLDLMCLPPCHVLFQFHVDPNRKGEPEKLSLSMYQRSCDVFLGVPFNIASYSLLLSMIAQLTRLTPKYFIHSMGDVHLYHDHFEQAFTQLTRKPYPLPELELLHTDEIKVINQYEPNDIQIKNYSSHKRLKAKMIV